MKRALRAPEMARPSTVKAAESAITPRLRRGRGVRRGQSPNTTSPSETPSSTKHPRAIAGLSGVRAVVKLMTSATPGGSRRTGGLGSRPGGPGPRGLAGQRSSWVDPARVWLRLPQPGDRTVSVLRARASAADHLLQRRGRPVGSEGPGRPPSVGEVLKCVSGVCELCAGEVAVGFTAAGAAAVSVLPSNNSNQHHPWSGGDPTRVSDTPFTGASCPARH